MKIVNHRLQRDDGTPYPFRDTPNKGGVIRPRWLVMHFTAGGSAQESISWLASSQSSASAHIVIDKRGNITQMVAFNRKAWHAGESKWKGVVGLNSHSIGIELDGFGPLSGGAGNWKFRSTRVPDADVLVAGHKNEPNRQRGWPKYPQAQLDAALELAKLLVQTYNLEDVIGHDDISPIRKVDPGPAFPMKSFRDAAMGVGAAQPPVDGPLPSGAPGARMRVTANSLNLRSGPGGANPPVAGSPLPNGTFVRVLVDGDGWSQVRVEGTVNGVANPTGWVSEQFLEPAPGPLFSTTASSLNIRSGPGASNATVPGSPLPQGTIVEGLEDSGGWKRVAVQGAVNGVSGVAGWVSAQFLQPAVVAVAGIGQPAET